MNTLSYLLARGSEPSTYAGAGALLAIVGVQVDPGLLQAGIAAATAVCGLAAILLKERARAS